MSVAEPSLEDFAPESFRFYRRALEVMHQSGIPFLVGGAYGFACYTGIIRHTKDLDLFLEEQHIEDALRAFRLAGYHSETVFRHWLGKAYHGDDFIDLIYSSGNAVCPVDARWFEHSAKGTVLGIPVRIIPAEEMIWQKMFIMERERFDGADVLHLIRARGKHLDWNRLLERAGEHWRVLLSHLVLFGYVYPDDRHCVPPDFLRVLVTLLTEAPVDHEGDPVCRGPILSRLQYANDTESWGYQDARVEPLGRMTPRDAILWTDAGRSSS